jgi:colanic acid biosynthesis glycosyl transferase WcaI
VAALVSVPSKIFKQMAAGRPILAVAPPGSELARLIQDADCGLAVPPDDPGALAEALRWAAAHPAELECWGMNGRRYLERYHSRSGCIQQLAGVLEATVSQPRRCAKGVSHA